MKQKSIKAAAEGGILDRRQFLLSELAFSSAYSLSTTAGQQKNRPGIGESLPHWMRTS